jgi:hypothetical protein
MATVPDHHAFPFFILPTSSHILATSFIMPPKREESVDTATPAAMPLKRKESVDPATPGAPTVKKRISAATRAKKHGYSETSRRNQSSYDDSSSTPIL